MVNAPDAGAQVARRAAENRLQMTATELSDAELALVAARGHPGGLDGPRHAARAARPAHPRRGAGGGPLPRRRAEGQAPRPRRTAIRARLAIAAIAVLVLGACWWVSPTRTAIGLFGAGLFCLVALRRRNRPRRRAVTRAFGAR